MNLIKYFEKQQMVTGVKAAYSMISELIRRSEAENGALDTWNFSNSTTVFDTYFCPYLNISKDCGIPLSANKNQQCFYSEDGGWYDILGVEPINNVYHTPKVAYKVVLKNGMSLGIASTSSWLYIIVDINGKRGQSIAGKDIFYFTINHHGRYSWQTEDSEWTNVLMTGQWERYTYTKRPTSIYNNLDKILDENCSKNSKASNSFYVAGGLCARALELNGWKIPNKYPW